MSFSVTVAFSCDRCEAQQPAVPAIGREAARRLIDRWHCDTVPNGWSRLSIGDQKMTVLALLCPDCSARAYRPLELIEIRDKIDARSRAEWEQEEKLRNAR